MPKIFQRICTVAAACVVIVACTPSEHPTSSSSDENAEAVNQLSCKDGCVIANSATLRSLSHLVMSDSGGQKLVVAFGQVKGRPGDAIRLQYKPERAKETGPAYFFLHVSGAPRSSKISRRDLIKGVTVAFLSSVEPTSLTLAVDGSEFNGDFSGEIIVTTDAALLNSTLQAQTVTKDYARAIGPTVECEITAKAGQCGASSWSASPFRANGFYGAFQSGDGTGVSVPITITFTKPILSVRVVVYDPTYPTNSFTASGPTGSRTFGFQHSGIPGFEGYSLASGTLTGEFTSVVLTPGDEDYVGYSMYVTAAVDTGPPRLDVDCDPAVVERGKSVTCSMRVTGGQTPKEPEWTFDSPGLSADLGGQIRYPYSDGDSASTTWSGTMVVSGSVSGSALIDGKRVADTARVEVTPRQWRAQNVLAQPRNVSFGGQGPLPPLPPVESELGRAVMNANLIRCGAAGSSCQFVSSGPNKSLGYYLSPPLRLDLLVYLNDSALATNSAWRQSFGSSRVDGRCSRTDIDSPNLRDLVAQHEGLNPDVHRNSHTRIYRDVMDTLGVTLLETAVIGVVPGVDSLLTRARNAALHESQTIDAPNSTRNPFVLPCRLF
jgi:hypothetical protein